MGRLTVERTRRAFVEEGMEAALSRKKSLRPSNQKFDGEKEAHLIAVACSKPPEGPKRWTVHLLADKMVELHHVDSISHEAIRQHLKKNDLKPWLKEQWCIPPEANADFVCAMEDVLDVYHRFYSPTHPLVCLDESSKQQVMESRQPLPAEPGKPERYDYAYERNGVRNLFMLFAPLEGWRHVKGTDRRTKVDFAHCIKDLLTVKWLLEY